MTENFQTKKVISDFNLHALKLHVGMEYISGYVIVVLSVKKHDVMILRQTKIHCWNVCGYH